VASLCCLGLISSRKFREEMRALLEERGRPAFLDLIPPMRHMIASGRDEVKVLFNGQIDYVRPRVSC
jgi:hypothetical protein